MKIFNIFIIGVICYSYPPFPPPVPSPFPPPVPSPFPPPVPSPGPPPVWSLVFKYKHPYRRRRRVVISKALSLPSHLNVSMLQMMLTGISDDSSPSLVTFGVK